eukprot:CAMPEP_0113694778 /NCGR_PEP_ID=MMETSP0038_2-20120614/20499_1 /TAXON_ID=2898 /ORGANISM="Cryptomonas paramecium" /LENGTH=50 /DNA_ID=CAMNT_0000617179 /DNA_START=173 /DNA_END=325 /DNA_ORIENTATION=- /assembly_acc=CAM_ASM_000170
MREATVSGSGGMYVRARAEAMKAARRAAGQNVWGLEMVWTLVELLEHIEV